MAKGMMFSITLFLLSSLLLALSIIIFNNTQATELRATEFGSTTKIIDLSSSIESSISEIYLSTSGINVEIFNNTVNITEELPNNNTAQLQENLKNFKNFVENQSNIIKLNLNNTNLTIVPTNIMYYGNGSTRLITNPDSADKITLTLDVKNNTIGQITWGNYNAGQKELRIIYKNSTTQIESSNQVDLSSDLQVTLASGSRTDVIITNTNQLSIVLQSNLNNVQVKTSIQLDKIAHAAISDYSTIDYSSLGITKTFKPIIM